MARKEPASFGPEVGEHGAALLEAASSVRRSSYHEWLKVPPVSGFEVVHVLQQVGFALQPGPACIAQLQRDAEVIEVPLSDRLEPNVLIAILQRARLTANGFLALLDA